MSELPQKIGPYRILQRLGAGGMGEVFLAHDERLDRRVAIKRIRPDTGLSPEQRERFRREARVAARLNHPAIVQVYDILQEGDVEHIVMEYVEGASLRALASQGPLDLPLALRLAREIADGLDAAHHEGIVHRDLKTENVLVTRTGHAKISDFGIAKLFQAGPEPELTGANMVVGTYRTMSPEQARGEAVDHRSDLFSFGTLLYEILTGGSPFVAENALATLNRILFHTPEPVRALRPEVPEQLSALVDQLLQKDPFLRPRSAGEVRRHLEVLAPGSGPTALASIGEEEPTVIERSGLLRPATQAAPADSALTTLKHRPRRIAVAAAVLLLAVLASGGAWLALRRPVPPLYVAVREPEIGTGAGTPEVELLASGVRVALLQGLVALEGISPLATDEVDAVSGPPRQVAQSLSAGEIVSSRLDCRPESCRISLNRLRGQDATVLWAESFEVPTDEWSLVASAVINRLRSGYGGYRLRAGNPDLAVSGRDFQEFLVLRRRLDARQEPALDSILAELAALRQRSPRFLDAYLLEADVARRRFWNSRDEQDLRHGLDLIQEARSLAPGDPRPLFVEIDLALAAQDLDRAEAAIVGLESLVPGDVRLLERRARVLSARGQVQEALELTRTAARLQPSTKRLTNLAQMEIQQGRIEDARHHLEMLLRRSPGSFDGLSLLAVIELSSGDLNRAVALYSDLVRRSPGLSQLSNLALAYFFLGRYTEAAGTYRRLLEQEPRNPFFTLNLADAYILMGRRSEAQELYRRVLELDRSATTPQSLTVKAQALAHLGRGREAVAAVQQALRLAPNDAPVAYEASLVYAVLSEDDSALANAERALELGYGKRWFSFPWFETLRRDPEFQKLLADGIAPR
ncbi:MAG TPA: protein kinase [Thermoanaerobaculia bacterium]|nr:protein kinase [Thermoanaerobaculia bacterium]